MAAPLAAAEAELVTPLRALSVRRGAAAVALGTLLDGDAPTVVSLWASYCVACRGESSTLVAARKQWGAKVVVVLADVDDRAAVAKFQRETKTPFDLVPIAPAQEDAVDVVAPEGFPTNYLLHGERVRRIDRLLTPADLNAFFRDH